MIWHKKNIKRSFINVDDDDDDDAELFLIIRDEHTKQKKNIQKELKKLNHDMNKQKDFYLKKR